MMMRRDPMHVCHQAWLMTGAPSRSDGGRHAEVQAHRKDDGDSFHRFEPSAKWHFSAVDSGQVGAAVSLTAEHEDGRFADWLLNVQLTYQLKAAPLTLLANAGWLRERDQDWSDRLFIGGGFECEAGPQATVIVQV